MGPDTAGQGLPPHRSGFAGAGRRVHISFRPTVPGERITISTAAKKRHVLRQNQRLFRWCGQTTMLVKTTTESSPPYWKAKSDKLAFPRHMPCGEANALPLQSANRTILRLLKHGRTMES